MTGYNSLHRYLGLSFQVNKNPIAILENQPHLLNVNK